MQQDSRNQHAGDHLGNVCRAIASVGVAVGGLAISGSSGICATIDRYGTSWQAVGYEELLNSSFWQFLPPPKSIYAGERVVTTGTFLNCDGREFRLRYPEGSIAYAIPLVPRLASPDSAVPSYGDGRPRTDQIPVKAWSTVAGFSEAKTKCDEFVRKSPGSPGFVVFGSVERSSDFNIFAVDRIAFAGYAAGMWQTIWNAVPSGSTRFLINLLASYYGSSSQ